MKKTLLILMGCLSSIAVSAQGDCKTLFDETQTYLLAPAESKPDYAKAYSLIQQCAENGDSASAALAGLLHLSGIGTEKDENKAFTFLMKAAEQGHPAAEYNIGRFYMIGTGCDINFEKALHWLTLASDHGDQQAAYSLGYMYLKGFGVKQDYSKAISWFEISSWPMAKHWLGNCYYFGYGVPKDENKAILYYSQSKTLNSEELLKHIAQNIKQDVDNVISSELKEKETAENTAIAKETIDKATETTVSSSEKKILKPQSLNGKWKGKLIELDWSGKEIVRVLPLNCEFSSKDEAVNYKWEINKTVSEASAVWEDNALYFDQQNMVFDWPFSDHPNINTIQWQLLSSQMEFKTINNKTYLVGNLQTFTDQWNEPGPPMRIILKPFDQDDTLADEDLLAISSQKEHFIVLYPNPFVSDVLVAYELEKEARISAEVYDLSGNKSAVTLEQGALQTAGKHQYTMEGSNLRPGMYIVRIAVDNQVHSRILIKK